MVVKKKSVMKKVAKKTAPKVKKKIPAKKKVAKKKATVKRRRAGALASGPKEYLYVDGQYVRVER